MSGTNFTEDDQRVVDLAMEAARTNGADLSHQVDNAVIALLCTNGALYKNNRNETGRQGALAIIEGVIEKSRSTSFSSDSGSDLRRQLTALRMDRVDRIVERHRFRGELDDDGVMQAASDLVKDDPYYRSLVAREGKDVALGRALSDVIDAHRDRAVIQLRREGAAELRMLSENQ
jgi:hypothetical protein